MLSPSSLPLSPLYSSLDSYSHKEDASAFLGKRALISFLSWLDYCDQLIKEAHKVGDAIVNRYLYTIQHELRNKPTIV